MMKPLPRAWPKSLGSLPTRAQKFTPRPDAAHARATAWFAALDVPVRIREREERRRLLPMWLVREGPRAPAGAVPPPTPGLWGAPPPAGARRGGILLWAVSLIRPRPPPLPGRRTVVWEDPPPGVPPPIRPLVRLPVLFTSRVPALMV